MITSGRQYLDTLANNYILKPANAKGLAGFVFDYEGDTQVDVVSEITDHYTEQNTFINDHAAQKPQRITLRGFVGEIVSNPNLGVIGILNTLQTKLTQLPALLGKYTPSQLQKISAATSQATAVVNKVDNTISTVQNVVGLFIGSSAAPTHQQLAYQNLFALWSNNAVFTLDTPFHYFKSVMIERMMFVQDETTKEWSEISVTVKEVRFINPSTTGGLSPQQAVQNLQGRASAQGQSQTNSGLLQGIKTSFSNLTSAFGTRTTSMTPGQFN